MPSGDSLAQCKSVSSERPFLLTLFPLPWNYPDGVDHKAQEAKNLVSPGPGSSQLPVQGLPSIQWIQNDKENTARLCLLWPSLALVCVTSLWGGALPPPNSFSHLALPLMALEQNG